MTPPLRMPWKTPLATLVKNLSSRSGVLMAVSQGVDLARWSRQSGAMTAHVETYDIPLNGEHLQAQVVSLPTARKCWMPSWT